MTLVKQLLIVLLVLSVTSSSATTISGIVKVCTGLTTTLTIDTVGGTWSSSNPGVASINATTGIVTGILAGGTVISYNLPGATFVRSLTSYLQPSAITGVGEMCAGATMMFANSMGYAGTWSSFDPSIATVVASNGRVTGVSGGVVPITYRVTASGCFVTREATVNALPDPIGVPAGVCPGVPTALISAPGGGVWASSNLAVATIDATSGVVTGISGGLSSYYLAVITYTLPTSCRRVTQITVNSSPGAIIGATTMCTGSTGTLICGTPGGTWSSSAPGVASISSTGVVSAINNGTTVINYTKPSGCAATVVVTVSTGLAANTGASTICVGQTTMLENGTTGGTWASDAPSVANVNATSGLVSGVNAGTANITYTVGAGCSSVTQVTVNSVSLPIVGTTTICVGGATHLTYGTPGGTWSSSIPANATVDATTGDVAGIAAGTSIVTYTIGTGCFRIATITVQAPPAAITGPDQVCEGSSIVVTSSPSGGAWTTDGVIASVTPSVGNVTGLTAGINAITYTTGASCSATYQITVNAPPAAISGTASTCVGGTTALSSDGVGVWSSSQITKATVNAGTGAVTGIAAGTSVITYMPASGCYRTIVVTVTAAPTAISGTLALCPVNNTTLSAGTSGKTWVSSDPSVASINATTGVVTALTAGNTTISYTVGSCSSAPVVMTVNAAPPPNDGVPIVCIGSNAILLTNTVSGGVWSGSNSNVILNPSSCLGRGRSVGTVNITYTTGPGCYAVTEVTVIPPLAAITGPTSVCPGSEVTLSHVVPGGTWSSTNTTKATIDASEGELTGLSSGVTTISYQVSAGCFTSRTETVVSPPSAIAGDDQICAGAINTFSISGGGGTWSTSNEAVASVSVSTGAVTGVTTGTAILTYRVTSTGCNAVRQLTVNPAPLPITGPTEVCVGNQITMEGAPTGGSWSVNYPVRAEINASTGVVTGMNAGTAIVTYTLDGGCYVTAIITVNSATATVSGPSVLCLGSTAEFTASVAGATWVSSNEAVATIDPITGVAGGVSTGEAVIRYVIPATGCFTIRPVTVNEPPVIEVTPSSSNICEGTDGKLHAFESESTLNNGTATISSGTISVAIPDNSSVGAYTDLVMSSVPSGVAISAISVTINLTHTYMGDMIINLTAPNGNTLNFFNRHGGGTNDMINTVVNSDGTISFVASAPPYTGTFAPTADIGIGADGFVSNVSSFTDLLSVANGVWTLSGRDAAGADLGVFTSWSLSVSYYVPTELTWSSVSGLFTDAEHTTSYGGAHADSVFVGLVVPGSTPVTQVYTVTGTKNGCNSTVTTSVTAYPGTTTGPSVLCQGNIGMFSNSQPGGTWISSNTTVASISPIGAVAGLLAGTSTISYILGDGACFVKKVIAVNTTPSSPVIDPTSAIICSGGYVHLVAVGYNGPKNVYSGSISVPIPDATASGAIASLAVGGIPTDAVVSGITATLNITHTYMADLIINLTAPNGSTLNLYNGNGGSSDNMINTVVSSSVLTVFPGGGGPYTSTYAAIAAIGVGATDYPSTASSFASLYSIPNGTWTLSVRDKFGIDIGTIDGFDLEIAYTVNHNITWAEVTGLYVDPELTDPLNIGESADSVNASLTSSTPVTQVYTVTNTVSGCSASTTVSVSVLTPSPIEGPATVCIGGTAALSTVAPGGTWAGGAPGIATIDEEGVVSGLSEGTAIVTYFASPGCYVTHTITVNPLSSGVITVPATVFPGSSISLTSTGTGGSWSSADPAVASVDASGVVTGIGLGTTVISYTVVSGEGLCPGITTANVTVAHAAALDFDGVDDYLTFTDDISGVTNFTFETWLYVKEHQTWNRIFDFGNGPSQYTFFSTSNFTSGHPRFAINIGFGEQIIESPVAIPTNTWTHMAITLDGTTANMYMNGELVVSNSDFSYTPSSVGATVNNYIGKSQYAVDAYLNAAMDEIRIWNVARTGSEISGSMHTSLSGSEPGLIRYYKFDQGVPLGTNSTVITAVDLTGHADGTLNNFALDGCASNWVCGMPSFGACVADVDITGPETVEVGSSVSLSGTGTGGTWSSSNTSIATVDPGTGVVTGIGSGTVTIYYNNSCGTAASHSMEVTGGIVMPCTPVYGNTLGSCFSLDLSIFDFSLPGAFGTSITDIGTGCDGTGYQNRIGIVAPPTLVAGSSYTATLRTGTFNEAFVQAWIDFNNDGVLDIVESIGGNTIPALGSFSFSVTIPESATTGVHVMRVRLGWVGASSPYPDLFPCDDLLFGEAHDYTVNIGAAARPGGQVTDPVSDIASFSVAPNPTTGNLTINTSVAGALAVYTIDGRELKRYTVAEGSSVVAMPSGLASGVYMLRFKGNDGSTKMMRIVYQP